MICYIEKDKHAMWPGWFGRMTHDISNPHYTGPASTSYYEASLLHVIDTGREMHGATEFILVERDEQGAEVQRELTNELITYYLLHEAQ